jgi:hypothetical protein
MPAFCESCNEEVSYSEMCACGCGNCIHCHATTLTEDELEEFEIDTEEETDLGDEL